VNGTKTPAFAQVPRSVSYLKSYKEIATCPIIDLKCFETHPIEVLDRHNPIADMNTLHISLPSLFAGLNRDRSCYTTFTSTDTTQQTVESKLPFLLAAPVLPSLLLLLLYSLSYPVLLHSSLFDQAKRYSI
jgi:hypothetical protein